MNKIKKVKKVSPEQCREAILAVRDSMEIWGGKWKLLILLYLTIKSEDKNGFMQILRGLEGISAKMLSSELKNLEVNKLVTRTINNTKPITVDYAITKYGKLFIPVAEQIVSWGLAHRMLIKNIKS